MLSPYELSLLFALAKDHWTGEGEIVDLGCLYGLTTRCFADGVRMNETVSSADKKRRVYAYDLFLAEDYEWWVQPSKTVHAGSWFSEFLDVVRDHLDFIAPCPGDLARMNWGGRPIEILMIDAAKSWSLNQIILERFFPRLIPGKSIVIQQDYVNHAEYWVAMTMERLKEYFEPLDFIYGASGVFCLTREIPAEALKFDISRQSIEANSRLPHGAIQKAPPSVSEVLKVAEAQFMFDQHHHEIARELLKQVRGDVRAEDHSNDFSEIAQGCSQILSRALDQIAVR
jgi:hypothetical protein